MSLDTMIAKMRRLGAAATEVAKAAVPYVSEALKSTSSAGTTPWGDAWAPRKRDGGRALANASAAIAVDASGPVVRVRLEGTSTGSAKVQSIQNHRRQIIPTHTGQKERAGEGLPPVVEAALERASRETFERMVRS